MTKPNPTSMNEYSEIAREAVRKAPALVLSLIAMLLVVWKGGDMMERQAERYTESQKARDAEFVEALRTRDEKLTDAMDVHIERYEDLLRATNVALDRTASALEANTRAFIEYNVRSNER